MKPVESYGVPRITFRRQARRQEPRKPPDADRGHRNRSRARSHQPHHRAGAARLLRPQAQCGSRGS